MNTNIDTEYTLIELPMKRGPYIKFQIRVFCYLNGLMTKKKQSNIQSQYKIITLISDADIDCMTLLGMVGGADLTEFCSKTVELGIFKSIQSTRNALDKLEDKGLVIKEGMSRKKVYLSPVLQVNSEKSVIEYRLIAVE